MHMVSGRNLVLRPIVEDQDWPLIFKWRNDVDTLYLWSTSRHIVSKCQFQEEFVRKMHSYFHCYFMIDRKHADELPQSIGMCYSYDVSESDGYAFICIYIAPSYVRKGYGVEAAVLLVDYLFTYLPLRKLYADVFGYNGLSLSTCQKAGFIVEGTFKAHRYFQGRYWDQYRLALYREDWERIRERLGSYLHRR